MANIFGVHPPNATKGIEQIGKMQARQPAGEATGVGDSLEISTAGKLAARIHDAGMVRTDLVERVRSEIADGTYETPERLDATVDRLLDDLFPELT